MRVVAVVPAWNARERLPAVLAGLSGQIACAVVVDNGSADGTAEWLAGGHATVRVIANRANRGFAAAVNQGVALSLELGADAVLLVNDDAVFQPGAVERLASALGGQERVGAASAKTVYFDRPDVINGTGGCCDLARAWAQLRGAGETDHGQYDDRPDVDYPSGAASLLRREALEEVGGFDEECFLYYEDVDWGLRARRAGWRTVFVPTAVVHHAGSAGTAADPARRRYYNVRNRLRFAGLWCPPRGRLHAWLATLGLLAKQPARWVTPRRRRDAEAVAWAVMDHLRRRYGRSGRYQ
jgi:GT2 family glycosyltransferase